MLHYMQHNISGGPGKLNLAGLSLVIHWLGRTTCEGLTETSMSFSQ